MTWWSYTSMERRQTVFIRNDSDNEKNFKLQRWYDQITKGWKHDKMCLSEMTLTMKIIPSSNDDMIKLHKDESMTKCVYQKWPWLWKLDQVFGSFF